MALKDPKVQYIDIQTFTGLNTLDEPYVIATSESPHMVNMDITKSGAVISRFGYEEAFRIPGGVGGIKGLVPYYRTYDTDAGDYLLIFNDGNNYVVTNQDDTPVNIGVYGTERNYVTGATVNNVVVFGNGGTGNTPKKWSGDILSPAVPLTGTPPNVSIFGVYDNRLFAAGVETGDSVLYYSDAESEDAGLATNFIAINKGNGEGITAIMPNADICSIYKDNSIYATTIQIDQTDFFTSIVPTPVISNQGGCYAQNTAQNVYGYTYYLSNKGIEAYGPRQEKITASLPLPLSFKIDPTIQNINFSTRQTFTSAFFEGRYLCGIALNGGITNNYVISYNETVKRRFGADNFTIYDGIPLAMFAVFRDADKKDRLYFGSNSEPVVYRFNTSFSDNGFGYTRLWRSKTFRFGERTFYQYLDLEGTKPVNKSIFVDLFMDGREFNGIEITDDNLIASGSGYGYLGDSYMGDVYTGAAFSTQESVPMFKWKKRINIADIVNEGYEFSFQVRNNEDQAGWKLTRAKIAFILNPEVPTYPYAST